VHAREINSLETKILSNCLQLQHARQTLMISKFKCQCIKARKFPHHMAPSLPGKKVQQNQWFSGDQSSATA